MSMVYIMLPKDEKCHQVMTTTPGITERSTLVAKGAPSSKGLILRLLKHSTQEGKSLLYLLQNDKSFCQFLL